MMDGMTGRLMGVLILHREDAERKIILRDDCGHLRFIYNQPTKWIAGSVAR